MFKIYLIRWTRKDGSNGYDMFEGKTPQEAIKDFKVCYRHGEIDYSTIRVFEEVTKSTGGTA